MSDSNPNENKSPNDNIGEELNQLGKNLRDALQAAWESGERQKLQKEIEDGLTKLGASLSQASQDFSNSPAGKTLKEDMTDLKERWQTGEVKSKVNSEIVEALRKVNTELQKATHKTPPPPSDTPKA